MFVLKSGTSMGVIHYHRKSTNMGKRLTPLRNDTDSSDTRISPVVVYSKIYILVYDPQCCNNWIVPLLEKQLERERPIHGMFNNPHEIFRVVFLSLVYVSNFCISHLSTQFCCVLFTHSSDLERKVATPRSKCLDMGVNYEFFIHSSLFIHMKLCTLA